LNLLSRSVVATAAVAAFMVVVEAFTAAVAAFTAVVVGFAAEALSLAEAGSAVEARSTVE